MLSCPVEVAIVVGVALRCGLMYTTHVDTMESSAVVEEGQRMVSVLSREPASVSAEETRTLLQALAASPSAAVLNADNLIDQLTAVIKVAREVSVLSHCCACVEAILRLLIAKSDPHPPPSVPKLVLSLLQLQTAGREWQEVAIHCLFILAWSFPSSVPPAAREWGVRYMTTNSTASKDALLLVIAPTQQGGKEKTLPLAVEQLCHILQLLQEPTASQHIKCVASSRTGSWLPLPPLPLEGSQRCLALHQQADLLARVVQYSLLLFSRTAIPVPLSDILTAVWIAAALKEELSVTRALPWRLLRVLCCSCGASLLPFSDSIEALLASSLHSMTLVWPPPVTCCLVCDCVREWLKIRLVPSAAFQQLAVSSLLLLAVHWKQAVLTAVEYSMATTSLSGYLLQETTALLHCLDSIATCCHIFGPDLSEVVVQGIDRLWKSLTHTSLPLPFSLIIKAEHLSAVQAATPLTPVLFQQSKPPSDPVLISSDPMAITQECPSQQHWQSALTTQLQEPEGAMVVLSTEDTGSEDGNSEPSSGELLLAEPRESDKDSLTAEELLEAFGGVYAVN